MPEIKEGQVYLFPQGETNCFYKVLHVGVYDITYTCTFHGDWVDDYSNSQSIYIWKEDIQSGRLVLINKSMEYLYG
jgi:hypothetical protein